MRTITFLENVLVLREQDTCNRLVITAFYFKDLNNRKVLEGNVQIWLVRLSDFSSSVGLNCFVIKMKLGSG
jgi:hypothetical protein